MQITQTKKEELMQEFNVVMTAAEIDVMINDKLEELGKTVKMPGFRPGKIPMTLLKSKYGKSVMGEVLEAAVNNSMLKAINENNLRPAMRPKIEVKSFDEASGLEYVMAIDLLPEITVASLDDIKLTKLTAKPQKKDVTEALERIASSNKESEKVEEARPAKMGDVVVIDFDGAVNGERQDGMLGKDFALELGSKSFIDNFEDQLVGSKVGDKKKVNVTFPKDYGKADLQGVKAVFDVEIKELRQPVKTKIDDDFAKKLGFEDLSKIEEIIEKQIQGEYDQLARMHLKRGLLDALDEKHSFKVPQGMVDAEFDGILHQMMPAHDHHDHEAAKKLHDEFGTKEEREEYMALAERRVKLGLVLAEIGRANNIQVNNQELQQAVIAEARRYQGQEKQVFEYYQKNTQALEALKAPIYEEKVVDFILEKSKVDAKEVSIDELTAAAEQEPVTPAAKAKKK